MNEVMKLGQTIASMIGTIAVIDLIALIIQGSDRLAAIRGENNKLQRSISLGVIGGLFGMYATISGVAMSNGAVISVRDVGPMMAGCLGGPLGGLIAGAIAGIQRLLYGLPDITAGSTIPCSISTFCIGLLCGLLFKSFESRERRGLWAMLIACIMEIFHLFIVFIYFCVKSGVEASLTLISEVAAPFLIANGIAFGLLVYILDMVEKYKKAEQHEKQVETELSVATSIQNDMLPAIFPDFPGRTEFSLDATMHPAKEVGGDFFDFFFIDDDHFAFLVADVSGKGVPAALFMVISKTIIKNNIQAGGELAAAVKKSNLQLCDGNMSGMFVTAWVGLLEISTGRLVYVNAGHNPPVLMRGGEQAVFIRDISGLVLAGMKKSVYKQFETYLYEGDKLFVYTDGVTEAMDEKSEQYGEKRLCGCLSAINGSDTAKLVIETVGEDIHRHIGNAEQSDDVTMLVLKMSGNYEWKLVKCEQESFDLLFGFMEDKLKRENVPEDIAAKLNVVLDELFSNIVKYSESEELRFGIAVYGGRVAMRLEYGGKLFDITTAKTPDVTLSAKDRPVGGLGLFIVKKLMDSVVYHAENGKNVVVLHKKFETGEADR